MKKLLTLILAVALIFSLSSCFLFGDTECTEHVDANEDGKCDVCEADMPKTPCDECVDADNNGKCDVCGEDVEPEQPGDGIMTHAQYVAAADDAAVKVKTYVQAKQSWWDNKATIYTQAQDGAYFLYNMPCTEAEYDALVPGTCIIVSGFKADYAGEKEIVNATYEIVANDTYVATATDLTAKFAAGEDLFANQNELFALTGAVVVTKPMYNWDGTGSVGNDLYFDVSVGGKIYTLVVESYLYGDGSALYDAVEALEVGNVINVEAFLYWYNGAQPHLTKLTVTADGGVSTFAEWNAAELDTEHTVITFVQAKQSWWNNKATVYTQSKDGAYFLYEMVCTEADYAKLTPGTCIKVTGFKADYAGEIEFGAGCTFEILGNNGYVPEAKDLTDKIAAGEDVIAYQNQLIEVKGAVVKTAAIYNWDGTGSAGNDLYLALTVGENDLTVVVESYLFGDGTELYDAVEALEVGDIIDLEAFLYWYNGAQPHLTSIVVK